MRLGIERLTTENRFWSRFDSLIKKTFPPEEYIEPRTLADRAAKENLDLLALTDDGSLVGIMVIKTYRDIAYLLYLVIDPSCRSEGYGGRAIETIGAEYPGRRLVVDFEMLDKDAPNNEQRLRRRQFYIKNGFKETGLFVTYRGMDFEVFCTSEDFNHQDYIDMWRESQMVEYPLGYFSK